MISNYKEFIYYECPDFDDLATDLVLRRAWRNAYEQLGRIPTPAEVEALNDFVQLRIDAERDLCRTIALRAIKKQPYFSQRPGPIVQITWTQYDEDDGFTGMHDETDKLFSVKE